MGMGNLENVLKDFGGGRRSYAELYFDSTPLRHPKAQKRLAGFGDDSSNYFWKLLAARRHHARPPQAGPLRPRGALLKGAAAGRAPPTQRDTARTRR